MISIVGKIGCAAVKVRIAYFVGLLSFFTPVFHIRGQELAIATCTISCVIARSMRKQNLMWELIKCGKHLTQQKELMPCYREQGKMKFKDIVSM